MTKTERATVNYLHQMEILPHLKGYRYIITGVQLILDRPDIIYRVTTELYPEISERHNTMSTRTERGIRHAIELGNKVKIQEQLYLRPIKITNTAFLAALAEKVKLELETEDTEPQESCGKE